MRIVKSFTLALLALSCIGLAPVRAQDEAKPETPTKAEKKARKKRPAREMTQMDILRKEQREVTTKLRSAQKTAMKENEAVRIALAELAELRKQAAEKQKEVDAILAEDPTCKELLDRRAELDGRMKAIQKEERDARAKAKADARAKRKAKQEAKKTKKKTDAAEE